MIDPLKTDLVFLPLLFARNRIEHIIEPVDTSLEDRSGLRYCLEILTPSFPQSPELERLVKMPGSEKPPVFSAGANIYEGAFFRIDELLNDTLERRKPNFRQTEMSVLVSLTMPVVLAESVENKGVLVPGSAVTRPKQYIIKAGLTEEDFAGWGSTFFSQRLAESRSFLTWQPDGKVIGQEQEEYLYFLFNQTPAPASVIRRVEVTFEDATTQTLERGSLNGVGLYQLGCIPVGPVALGLNELPKQVVSYRVWLSDGNLERLSEVRTFQIDQRYRAQERLILFSNSLGGWDSLRLLGEGFETLKTTRSSAEIERPLGAVTDFPEIRVVYLEGERELQISTGWIERNQAATLRYFDELLLSEEIYLVTDKGHLPLELVTNSLRDSEDFSELISRSFTFRRTTPVYNFSSLPVAPVVSARPTAWRGVGLVELLDSVGKRTGLCRPIKLQKYYTDDNSLFKPRTEKPNIQGDPDYIFPVPSPDAVPGSTPYPSALISRAGSYKRSNCGANAAGGSAIITIPAGKYGGEKPGDADLLAEAEFKSLDSQAYADQYGTCSPMNEFYSADVPANHFRYRTNQPSRLQIYHKLGPTDMGNAQAVQDLSGPYIYPPGTNDLDFPAVDKWWYYIAFGEPYQVVKVSIYRNGALVQIREHGLNYAGFEINGIMTNSAPLVDVTPQSGDRWYIKLETL